MFFFVINIYCKCINLIVVKFFLSIFCEVFWLLKGIWFNKYSRNVSVLIFIFFNCCFVLECFFFVRIFNKWFIMVIVNLLEFFIKESILK